MVVIVDAYNVIRLVETVASSKMVSEAERSRFIARLQGYVSARRQTIKHLFAVFDGGVLRTAETHRRGDLTEVYAGFVDTADDWIVKHVSRSGFSDYVVVTNDRGLKKRVAPYVKMILSAEDFLTLLRRASRPQADAFMKKASSALIEYENPDEDTGGVDRDYLRELMEKTTRGMLSKKPDDVVENASRASGSDTDSKELIRVRRIVKKL